MGIIIWTIAAYFTAKKVNEDNELGVNPIWYAVFSALFGYVFSMSLLLNRYYKKKESKVGNIVTLAIATLMIIINIMAIF